MHTDLLEILYILSLPEDKLDEYLSSLQLHGDNIVLGNNGEVLYSELNILITLCLYIFEKLYVDYEYLDDYAQELINEMVSLFKIMKQSDFYFLTNILRETSKKVLKLIDIELIEPQSRFDELLYQYNFEIQETSYKKLLDDCKSYYPFDRLITQYETGKKLDISDEERQIYGNFSKDISNTIKCLFDNVIDDLIQLEDTSCNARIQRIQDLIHKLNKIDEGFKIDKGYALMSYHVADEIMSLVFIIAETVKVEKQGFLDLFSEWESYLEV